MRNNKLKNEILVIIGLTIIISVSGCSLHKSEISSSLIEMPPSYSNDEQEPSPPAGRWWEQFNDDTLNELMEEAIQRNLDIAQSYEQLMQSIATMQITDSSRGLIVNIDGSGGRARQAGPFGPITNDTFSLSAAANYELDLWGKLKSNSNAAQLDVLASRQDLEVIYISTTAQLADLYYLAVEQRAQLELTDQTISSFQDTLDRVERRYNGGLVPAIDVYQSRQNLASAKAQRPLFESTLSTTLHAMSVLTGQFPDNTVGGSSKELSNAPSFESGLPSQLLSRRPDIKAALSRLKASDERIGAAIADRFPSFNLIGAYGGNSDTMRTILDSPNIFWNILLQTAQPVLDGGRRKAEVERTRAVFNERLVLYHKTVLNAFREVEDALAKGSASEERIRLLEETVSASDDSLRLALDRYMQGLTDYLPVLTEQLRNATAKSNLLAARRQLISNRIQLVRAIGGEWTDNFVKQYTRYKRNESND
jgi:NodT family efflux transporter outer membrane factor (OMF) lipoprotein